MSRRVQVFRSSEEINEAVRRGQLSPHEGEAAKTLLAGNTRKEVHLEIDTRADLRREAHH